MDGKRNKGFGEKKFPHLYAIRYHCQTKPHDMLRLLFIASCFATILISCSSKPSNKDLEKHILIDYVCNETAKVHGLKVINTEKTENMMGGDAWRYTVSGEVEWPEGCREFGTGVQPGTREKFEKTITLSKTDSGDWQ